MNVWSAALYGYVFFQSAGIEALFLRMSMASRGKHFWLKSFLINAITHPLVVFLLLADGWMKNFEGVIVAETFAVVSETFLMSYTYKKSLSISFALSLGANLLSWQLAPLLTWCAVKALG